MRIVVQNMVCRHCVAALSRIFEVLEVEPREVGLGYVIVEDGDATEDMLARLDVLLKEQGFVRISDREDELVEQVKEAVQHHVRSAADCRLKLSACIEERVGVSYDSLSRLFSARQGRTIENYAIAMRIERVKELLSYGTMTVAEIADATGFSGAAHLSRQFKAVTGLTPTQFVASGAPRRSLAEI